MTIFVFPLGLAVVPIAGIVALHSWWWPTIPLMHYWTAYGFIVIVQLLWSVVVFLWAVLADWLD